MKLKILIASQIFFFAVFGGWLYINRADFVSEFWLETAPVDPRDILSGTYVALRYAQEDNVSECAKKLDKYVYRIWVHFSESEKKFRLTDGRSGNYYEVKDCSLNPVYEKNWAMIKLYPSSREVKAVFPERYYLNEKDPKKDIRASEAAVKVRIQRDKTLTITELAELAKDEQDKNSGQQQESGSDKV